MDLDEIDAIEALKPLLIIIFLSEGKVLMVDGSYAAVRFHSTSGKDGGKDVKDVSMMEESSTTFQDCRLLRKDELQVCAVSFTFHIPTFLIRYGTLILYISYNNSGFIRKKGHLLYDRF